MALLTMDLLWLYLLWLYYGSIIALASTYYGSTCYSKVLKTALGAAAYVPHSHHASTLALVRQLQADSVTLPLPLALPLT